MRSAQVVTLKSGQQQDGSRVLRCGVLPIEQLVPDLLENDSERLFKFFASACALGKGSGIEHGSVVIVSCDQRYAKPGIPPDRGCRVARRGCQLGAKIWRWLPLMRC